MGGEQILNLIQFFFELGEGVYHAFLLMFRDPPKYEREKYEDSGWTTAGYVILSPVWLISRIMKWWRKS